MSRSDHNTRGRELIPLTNTSQGQWIQQPDYTMISRDITTRLLEDFSLETVQDFHKQIRKRSIRTFTLAIIQRHSQIRPETLLRRAAYPERIAHREVSLVTALDVISSPYELLGLHRPTNSR